MSLSDKMHDISLFTPTTTRKLKNILLPKDIKQFIKELKEKLHGVIQEYPAIEEDIDELAGKELI